MHKSSSVAIGRVLFLLFVFVLSGCERIAVSGPQGRPGEPGEQGPAGPVGPRGLPGTDAMRVDVRTVLAIGDVVDGGRIGAVVMCEDGALERLLSGSCTWGKSLPTVQPFRAEPITDPETGEPIGFLCEGVPNNVNGEAPMVQTFAICEGEHDD